MTADPTKSESIYKAVRRLLESQGHPRHARGRQVTPADYCDAMARWWRYEPASDPPFVTASTKAIARAVFSEEWMPGEYDGASANEHHAAAWDRAAARLRGAK